MARAEEWYARTIEIEDGMHSGAGTVSFPGRIGTLLYTSGRAGDFIAAQSSACGWVVWAIEWTRRLPARRTSSDGIVTRREVAWERPADDVLDDAVPAFDWHPFVACA